MVFRSSRNSWPMLCGLVSCLCASLSSHPVLAQASVSDADAMPGSVSVSVSGAGSSPIVRESDSATVEKDEAAPVRVSVQRAANLTGNPSTIRPENFGDTTSTVSFSSEPVVMLGAKDFPSGFPLASAQLSSRFGARRHPIYSGSRLHAGIDLAAPYGTPILATANGKVARAGSVGNYGLMVQLDHGGGLETRYAHMSRMIVHSGEEVQDGQVIGYVGSTGQSTGPHLHYETRVDGRAVDPLTLRPD